MNAHNNTLFPELERHIATLDTASIPEERKQALQPLIDYMQAKRTNNEAINLNFICTHNSRRSHLSQVWARALAWYYNIDAECYSGGTEATALFPVVATTLEKQGFRVTKLSEGSNPVYSISFAENAHPVIGFSKTYDDAFNPTSGFAAVMTCSQADAGCPFIAGAETRIPITYDDPKAFDGTPQQEEKYRERSTQIATELNYVFATLTARS